jgi:hypothetical protein
LPTAPAPACSAARSSHGLRGATAGLTGQDPGVPLESPRG